MIQTFYLVFKNDHYISRMFLTYTSLYLLFIWDWVCFDEMHNMIKNGFHDCFQCFPMIQRKYLFKNLCNLYENHLSLSYLSRAACNAAIWASYVWTCFSQDSWTSAISVVAGCSSKTVFKLLFLRKYKFTLGQSGCKQM